MIGVGIVTCNRPDFFVKCYKSIPKDYNITVVNDGTDFEDWKKLQQSPTFEYIHNKQNIGVGRSKNVLFRSLLKKGCEHIFLIEDDIIVKDPKVFEKYIEARNVTGIHHFNFGYHGPANKNNISGGPPAPRFIVEYPQNIRIAINAHSVGAFCYYTKEVLEKVGLMDEEYTNAFEHVDHDYRIFKAGYGAPYWAFPDLADSMDYLDEIQCSEASSAIRPRKDWMENIQKGVQLFIKKHGYSPAWQNCVPVMSETEIKKVLKDVYKKHAKRK